mgnify:CR=1 FL=1
MPVFDFNSAPEDKKEVQCTYTTFCSNEDHATPECPILVLDNQNRKWNHHSCGVFTNQNKQTAFEFKEEDGVFPADILKIDSRFTSLIRWFGENHINIRLSGQNTEEGYETIVKMGERIGECRKSKNTKNHYEGIIKNA